MRYSVGSPDAVASVQVRFTDAELIGRLVSHTCEDGHASINGPRWYISPTNPIRPEAAVLAAIEATFELRLPTESV